MNEVNLLTEQELAAFANDILSKAQYENFMVECNNDKYRVVGTNVINNLPWRSSLYLLDLSTGLRIIVDLINVKPILRRIDSITEEEKRTLPKPFRFNDYNGGGINDGCNVDNLNPIGDYKNRFEYVDEENCAELADWLDKHKIDSHGLLNSKYDIAVEATEGIYLEYDPKPLPKKPTFGTLKVGDYVYVLENGEDKYNVHGYRSMEISEIKSRTDECVVFVFKGYELALKLNFPTNDSTYKLGSNEYFVVKDDFLKAYEEFINERVKSCQEQISWLKERVDVIKLEYERFDNE